jgi:hypothetical protein
MWKIEDKFNYDFKIENKTRITTKQQKEMKINNNLQLIVYYALLKGQWNDDI